MSELTKAFIEEFFPRVKIGWKDEPVLRALNRNIRAYENNWKKILSVYQRIEHCKEKAKKISLVKQHKKYLAIEKALDRKDIALRKQLGIYLDDPCGGKACQTKKPNCTYPEIITKNNRKVLWCTKFNIPAQELIGRITLSKAEWTRLERTLAKRSKKRQRG